jgi:hypothetical protein
MKASPGCFSLFAVAIVAVLSFHPGSFAGESAVKKDSDKAPLGSPDFFPSPEHGVGWRGDGSGRYVGATPPTTWSRGEKGEKKNIVWETKLPCYTFSTPIIVGDKIFTRSEPYDLICLDKKTGKILWIRSHPVIEGLSADEKKANPAFKNIEALVEELQKLNDQFVSAGWAQDLCKKKHDLQRRINDETTAIDKKYAMPADMYVESWSGYTGNTPCSDGKYVCIDSGDGVIACYDLNGNKKWARFESCVPAWGEHGKSCSPAIVGDVLIYNRNTLTGLNKETGAELWKSINFWDPFSIIHVTAADTDFVCISGNFIRVKDGKVAAKPPADNGGGLVALNGNMLYLSGGRAGFYKWEAKSPDAIALTPLIPGEYNRIDFPFGQNPEFKSKLNETLVGFYVASPLYNDGLLYCLGIAGRLVVVDTNKTDKKDMIVYSSFPPFDFKNGFGRKSPGFGMCSSPALAGKYIYMTDSAGCTVVMEPGREYKQVAKNNIDCIVPEWPPLNGKAGYYTGPHHEQTEASLVFEGSRIYLRGEQNLYCIGEK